jgi:hypothetical protein
VCKGREIPRDRKDKTQSLNGFGSTEPLENRDHWFHGSLWTLMFSQPVYSSSEAPTPQEGEEGRGRSAGLQPPSASLSALVPPCSWADSGLLSPSPLPPLLELSKESSRGNI